MGVRIPQSINVKNAIFTVINDELTAVFALNYVPSNSVRNAVESIMGTHSRLYFSTRDFNITPLMIEQKFKVPLDGIDFVSATDTYSVFDTQNTEDVNTSAIIGREGLGPLGDTLVGGKQLKRVSLIATIVSIAGAALGLLLLYMLFWRGEFASTKVGNILAYMLSMFVINLLVCGFASKNL